MALAKQFVLMLAVTVGLLCYVAWAAEESGSLSRIPSSEGGAGEAATIQVVASGGGAQTMKAWTVNGVKNVEVAEGDKKVKIHEDPQQGIKIEITTTKDNKDVTEKFEAKDAEDLKKKHPEAYEVYRKYAGNQAGATRIRIRGGGLGGGIPINPGQQQARPAPAPKLVPRVGLAGGLVASRHVEAVTQIVQSLSRQIEPLVKEDVIFSRASAQSKDDLKKEIGQLKQHLADLEKKLDQKVEEPAEKKPADAQKKSDKREKHEEPEI
jgi:hypothetical protein